jgi:TP901 family phage tail tape measure protein
MAGDMKFAMLLSVIDKATAPLKAVRAAFAGAAAAGESLGKLSQSLHDSRENIQDFADRGTAALQSLIEPASQVEQALLALRPVAEMAGGDSVATLQAVQQASDAYSRAHTANAADYIAVSTQMMRADKGVADAITATNVAMRLATSATTEAKGAATTLNVLYDSAGNKAADYGTELGHLADILTRTKQVYGDAFNVGELSDPLKDATAAARDAKVPVEQIVGALGALGAAGILGGEGGAAVANVITGLQAAAKPLGFELQKTATGGLDVLATLKAVVAKYGDLRSASPEALAAMQTAFGSTWRDVSLLLNQTDRLSTQWGAIGKSAGSAANAQAAAESTMSAQLVRLDNQLNSVKVTLGTAVMGAAASLAPELIKCLEPLAKFVGQHPKLAAIAATVSVLVVGVSSVVAPLMSAGSALVGMASSALTAAGAIGAAGTASAAAAGEATAAGVAAAGATGGIGAITASCWAWAAALLANPITWIVAAVIAAVALIYIYWGPLSAYFIKLWASIKTAFVGAWQSVVSTWQGAVAWFGGIWGGIRSAFYTAWDGVVGFVGGIWGNIKAAFSVGIMGVLGLFMQFQPITWIVKALDAVTQWLFGFSLIDAGSNIINTLTQGMVNAASGPIEAIKSIVQRVRNYLPFSPAKEGPLKDLHRVKLVETIASAVHPEPLVNAMRGATALAMGAVTSVAAPQMAAIPPSVMSGSQTAVTTSQNTSSMSVTFQFADTGASAVSQLESWIRDPSNARALANAVQSHQSRVARTELG